MSMKWKHGMRSIIIAPMPMLVLALGMAQSAIARDRDDHHESKREADPHRLGVCVQSARTGEISRRCFDRLVKTPEVNAVLSDRSMVPGLVDGRLTIDDISRSLQIGEASPDSREEGIEPDPEEIQSIDRTTLNELRSAEPFDIATEVFTQPGAIVVENFFPDEFPSFSIPPKPHLDIPGFVNDLHATLAANVNGYAMRMRKDGATVATLQWNWARNPYPLDAPAVGWNTNRRMHIASVSKFMTAIGVVKLLKQKGISTQAKIINYLPAYWHPGPNIALIDFEDLMNHLSGFSTGGSSATFSTIKSQVEGGVSAADVGVTYDYENMNFGLMRILMATIGGYISKYVDLGFEPFTDMFWTVVTADAYHHYMETQVFNPHGAFPILYRTSYTALASRYDASGNGWDSGSFVNEPGGYGWHMTINEVLNIARALRTGQIISQTDALELLNQSWGLNSPINGESTPAGPIYYKPGLWWDNNNPMVARTEQCVLLIAPDNIEIAVFINSVIGPSGQSLQNLVRTLYKNHIVP